MAAMNTADIGFEKEIWKAAVSYAKIAQKAAELSEKLSGVNDELTPKQQKRYVSILNKMTEMANRE